MLPLALAAILLTPVHSTATASGETFKLMATDAEAGDMLGYAASESGTLAILGAPEDTQPDWGWSGSAHVFDTTTGQELHKLLPPADTTTIWVGQAVGISGTTASVGAPWHDLGGSSSGAAYLFDTTNGQQIAKLEPEAARSAGGFGTSVAIDGTTAVVGSSGYDPVTRRTGSVLVFDTTTGQQTVQLVPAPDEEGGIGTSVGISGTTVIVGSYTPPGNAWIFDAASGRQLHRFDPLDGTILGRVAISGTRALIESKAGPATPGSVDLYDTTTGERLARYEDVGGDVLDRFGGALAIDGTTAVVGAWGDNDIATDAGAAYVCDAGHAIAVPYCFGDGAGGDCPCDNNGGEGNGCANGDFAEGARLRSTGTPCVTADGLVLRASSSPAGQPGLFFQGDERLNGGLGLTFGDGLRCAGGGNVRLEVAHADGSGAASSSVSISASGGVIAGDIRRYQWWYRDPITSPCGAGFNLSNGLEVVWGP